MLQTELTTRFGLAVPIAQAGLAFAGMTPALAAAVAEAGGLGAIAVGAAPPPAVEAFAGGFAQAAPGKPLNLNFITVFTTDEHIDAVCAAAPSVASFHWGHPKPEWIARLSEAGVSVWEQVGTVARAVAAVDASDYSDARKAAMKAAITSVREAIEQARQGLSDLNTELQGDG